MMRFAVVGLRHKLTYPSVMVTITVFAALGGASTAAAAKRLPPPTARTTQAYGVEETEAVLAGFINPRGQRTVYRFQWGLSKSYGNIVPDSPEQFFFGHETQEVEEGTSDLREATTYHYRIVAYSKGGTTYGGDRTFRTTGRPGTAGPWYTVCMQTFQPGCSVRPHSVGYGAHASVYGIHWQSWAEKRAVDYGHLYYAKTVTEPSFGPYAAKSSSPPRPNVGRNLVLGDNAQGRSALRSDVGAEPGFRTLLRSLRLKASSSPQRFHGSAADVGEDMPDSDPESRARGDVGAVRGVVTRTDIVGDDRREVQGLFLRQRLMGAWAHRMVRHETDRDLPTLLLRQAMEGADRRRARSKGRGRQQGEGK